MPQFSAMFHLKSEVTTEMVLLNEYKNHSVKVIFVATTMCTKHKLEILNGRYHLGSLGRGGITTVK